MAGLFVSLVLALAENQATGCQEPANETQEIEATADSNSEPLPDWVARGSYKSGDDFFVLVQTAGTHSSMLEADNAMLPACQDAIADVISTWQGDAAAAKIKIAPEYIQENLVVGDRMIVRSHRDDLNDELAKRFGKPYVEVFRGYAQLKLTPTFRNFVDEQWIEEQTRSRLVYAGVIGATIIGLLTILFGYLRLDRATRGFYTTRLQTVFVAIVLVLVALVIWITNNCEWI